MIIAVSGAHGTGKTTLVEELARRNKGLDIVEEPYLQLTDEGHFFAQPPSVEDYEAQLERSVSLILDGSGDRILDRCPLDFLAYLAAHSDPEMYNPSIPFETVREAMANVDLVVFVPIEEPDRIPDVEFGSMRRRVDEELREIVMEDRLDLGLDALEAFGSTDERAGIVAARLRASHGSRQQKDKHPEQ